MAIDLKAFNAIASGKYNAGEILLSKDGKNLDKVNNHVSLKFLNGKSIDTKNIYDTKMAFLNALKSEGLNDKSIESIRDQLGLPEEGSFTEGHKFTLMPLTRGLVRRILDKYNGELGEAKGRDKKMLCEEFLSPRKLAAVKKQNQQIEKVTKKGGGLEFNKIQDIKQRNIDEAKRTSKIGQSVNDGSRAARVEKHLKMAEHIFKNGVKNTPENVDALGHKARVLYLLLNNPGSATPESLIEGAENIKGGAQFESCVRDLENYLRDEPDVTFETLCKKFIGK